VIGHCASFSQEKTYQFQSSDVLTMAEESEHLLTTPDHELGYKNKGSVSSDEEYDFSAAVKIINEQSKALEELRKELSEERTKNGLLTDKMENLSKDFQTLQEQYATNTDKRNEELEKFKSSLEAKTELQASVIDELRFQMQSMRNKIDSNRGMLIENGNPASPARNHLASSGKQPLHEVMSPKKLLRNNSEDSVTSTGSNPCLMSRVSTPHRAEFMWRINAFTKKLKRIRSNSYDDPSRSEAFMTGPHGYRLSMWAYLNGRGKGVDKCLSLYVRVMAGEYDPILSWPIKPCYTFQLISQCQDANKRLDLVRVRDLSIKHGGIARPQKDDKSVIVGFDDFVVHEDVEKKEYLLDDSLFIKCVVEIS